MGKNVSRKSRDVCDPIRFRDLTKFAEILLSRSHVSREKVSKTQYNVICVNPKLTA